MFNFLKEKKLKKELELHDFSKNIDLSMSENFQIDSKETSPLFYNTYVFYAHSFDKRQTLYFKYTLTPVQTEVIVYLTDGYNKYVLEQQIYTSNCPLKLFRDDENKWNITFNNYLKKNNKDNAKFTFSSKFECNDELINKNSFITKETLFESLKKEVNYKDKINEIKNNDNVSYSQKGTLKGRMILEGQSSTFELSCIKIHKYGKIDYSTINNHIDLTVFEKDVYINYALLSQPNLTLFENGIYIFKKQEIQYLVKSTYEKQLFTRGTAPTYLNITLQFKNEKEITLHIKKIEDLEMNLQEEQYKLIISVVEILMEGKKYRGILECGYNADSNKWFNGRDIQDI